MRFPRFHKREKRETSLIPDNLRAVVLADMTITTQDVVFASGTLTLTLPSARAWARSVSIKNIGTGSVTIQGPYAQTIDGASNLIINIQYTAYTLIPDGTNWLIF
jgi:hypothetical protein